MSKLKINIDKLEKTLQQLLADVGGICCESEAEIGSIGRKTIVLMVTDEYDSFDSSDTHKCIELERGDE